jgi:NAD(P)-dependent dehydrogenase (short-subunit alcohol dehydrogenase family)
MRLKGKVAIITGAAMGLGEDNARLFAKEGAKVVIADIADQDGERVANEIRAAGGEALFIHLDVTRENDWKQGVRTVVERYGKVDILVNNAGISIKNPSLHETPAEVWDKVYGVNAKGTFLGTRTVIPEMKKSGGGSIVNISSTAALVGGDNAGVYHAAKGAIRSFTKAVAVEFGRDNIRCNSLHPGPFNAGLLPRFLKDPEKQRINANTVPMGRRGEALEESYAVLYLASDESTFTTGAELTVDGGQTIRGGSQRGMT